MQAYSEHPGWLRAGRGFLFLDTGSGNCATLPTSQVATRSMHGKAWATLRGQTLSGRGVPPTGNSQRVRCAQVRSRAYVTSRKTL